MSVISLFWNEMPSRTDIAKEVCSVALLDILSNQSLQLILIIKNMHNLAFTYFLKGNFILSSYFFFSKSLPKATVFHKIYAQVMYLVILLYVQLPTWQSSHTILSATDEFRRNNIVYLFLSNCCFNKLSAILILFTTENLLASFKSSTMWLIP